MDFTTVVGVDASHLRELQAVWPTWRRWRPELFERPLVVFHDPTVDVADVVKTVAGHPNVEFVQWPIQGCEQDVYPGMNSSKWDNQQRAKMLAGFVYAPARAVRTPYWLKLDTDLVAFNSKFPIVPESCFDGSPAIIAHPWGYTKPPDQIDRLDAWVRAHASVLPELAAHPSLELHPEPGATRVSHKRIISFCALFQTEFTCLAAEFAERACGYGHIHVASQDGYHFYVAQRLGLHMVRINMKQRGWEHRSPLQAVKLAVQRSLADGF